VEISPGIPAAFIAREECKYGTPAGAVFVRDYVIESRRAPAFRTTGLCVVASDP